MCACDLSAGEAEETGGSQQLADQLARPNWGTPGQGQAISKEVDGIFEDDI